MRGLAAIGCVAILTLGTAASGQSGAPASEPTVAEAVVDPEAVDALKLMSTYLQSLQTFELTATSSLDVVTASDQRVQMDAVTRYKVMKPGIRISFDSDVKDREFFYDGKTFTVFAPKLGFYASAPAPATNREFVKAIYDKFGVELPLADLFRWSDSDKSDVEALTSAFSVGTAKIDGVETDHWAFRQGDYDWEVWIEQGDRPLPRKLVIVDRTDDLRPGYTARLSWVVNPALNPADFTYVPGADAKRIQIATFTGDAK
jgi:hypothetical protein